MSSDWLHYNGLAYLIARSTEARFKVEGIDVFRAVCLIHWGREGRDDQAGECKRNGECLHTAAYR